MWLHEQEVIQLNKGLAVFRPAMTIRLQQGERRGFAKVDFEPLAFHYDGQILQIHVMAEYAARGLVAMNEAQRLASDYFTLERDEFIARWLPGRHREFERQTTPESWGKIVENLKNPVQQRIVADDREETNVLVLAGPGSGKTRVLVHRIAYLIRVRRESPRGILALAYNRHAAVDIRRRLRELIKEDARGVTVLTCHALAMRLAGASFTGRAERPDDEVFREVIRRAVALLHGEDLPAEEADERRERLLAGFRWILVDEYQDIGSDQYELISALAGRTLEDQAGKLTLFAVGDDDQNIYAFQRHLGGIHPPFREGLRSQADLSDGKLPFHSTHRGGGQRRDRAGAGADEGRTSHPGQSGARQGPCGRSLGRPRFRLPGTGADPAGRRRSRLSGAGCHGGALASFPDVTRLGLGALRRDRTGVGIPGPGARLLRGARRSGADGQRGDPEFLAPPGDPGAGGMAARAKSPPGR